MRFKRMDYCEFRDTYRKRLAFLRKQHNERSSYPLFSDQIAAEQISVDDEMADRRRIANEQRARDRCSRAGEWRRARSVLAQHAPDVRAQLLAFWSRCGWPADPPYFLTMLHMFERGRLDMNPVHPAETEARRHAVNAVIARILARPRAHA